MENRNVYKLKGYPFSYQVGDQWTHVQTLGIGFKHAAILQLQRTFLVVGGGIMREGVFRYHSKVLRYDPSTVTFTEEVVENPTGMRTIAAELIPKINLTCEEWNKPGPPEPLPFPTPSGKQKTKSFFNLAYGQRRQPCN